jgi:anaerobic selenocysteine-containing dehydrogenase
MFEQIDIVPSYFHDYINLNEIAIKPVGESKSNVNLFKALGRGVGLRQKELYESEEEIIDNLLKTSSKLGTNLATLRKHGFAKSKSLPLDIYQTPSGKIEVFSQKAVDDGLPALPDHSAIIGTAPFQLLTPLTMEMNHSSCHLISDDIKPKILMNPNDAALLSLKTGQEVILENPHGSIQLPIEISERVPRKILVSYVGFWPKLCGGSNINFLTSDYIQKFGGNSAYQSTFVKVVVP